MAKQAIEDAPKGNPESFADRLNKLFTGEADGSGRRYTAEAISDRCAQLGTPISVAYLYHLRRGARTNPGRDKVVALAKAFGVSPGYFFQLEDTSPAEEEDHAVRIAMGHARVRSITLRAAELSPDFLAALDAILRNLESLPGAITATTSTAGEIDSQIT